MCAVIAEPTVASAGAGPAAWATAEAKPPRAASAATAVVISKGRLTYAILEYPLSVLAGMRSGCYECDTEVSGVAWSGFGGSENVTQGEGHGWRDAPFRRVGAALWDQPDRQSVELIELALQVGEMLRFSLLPRPALRLRLSLPDELKSVCVVGGFD